MGEIIRQPSARQEGMSKMSIHEVAGIDTGQVVSMSQKFVKQANPLRYEGMPVTSGAVQRSEPAASQVTREWMMNNECVHLAHSAQRRASMHKGIYAF
jgi:hypothetical protein